MQRIYILGILLLPISYYLLPVQAQQTDSLWLSVPESVCPAIKSSEIITDTLTNDFFSASVTSASQIQMRRLHGSDGKDIICVVRTYNAPEADSEVEFYDTSWNRVGALSFDSVFTLDSKLSVLLQPLLISVSLNSENTDLLLTINPVQLSDEDKKKLKDVNLQRTLKWDGKTFK